MDGKITRGCDGGEGMRTTDLLGEIFFLSSNNLLVSFPVNLDIMEDPLSKQKETQLGEVLNVCTGYLFSLTQIILINT